jgi:hypothetical protein
MTALLTGSILTTPLVALKKRGFNVDRLLNQQREQKLRSQAEASREADQRRSQAEEALRLKETTNANSPATLGGRGKSEGSPLLSDDASHGAMTPSAVIQDREHGSSIMEQVAKKNPFMHGGLKAKLPSFMDRIPGAFNPRKGADESSPSVSGLGSGSGLRGSQQSTKQVSSPLTYYRKKLRSPAQRHEGYPIDSQYRHSDVKTGKRSGFGESRYFPHEYRRKRWQLV